MSVIACGKAFDSPKTSTVAPAARRQSENKRKSAASISLQNKSEKIPVKDVRQGDTYLFHGTRRGGIKEMEVDQHGK